MNANNSNGAIFVNANSVATTGHRIPMMHSVSMSSLAHPGESVPNVSEVSSTSTKKNLAGVPRKQAMIEKISPSCT